MLQPHPAPNPNDIELHPDTWERFVDAVKRVARRPVTQVDVKAKHAKSKPYGSRRGGVGCSFRNSAGRKYNRALGICRAYKLIPAPAGATGSMKISDMMAPDGRVFLKSEWGLISDEWPCVSFTRKSVGDRLRAEFRPDRDILMYVGTTNADMTEDPEHRGRLLSAVVIQPNQVLETRKIVPAQVWERSVSRWGYDRWPYAMAVTRAANVAGEPLPHAHDIIPMAYRSFSEFVNRGGVIEALGQERRNVMALDSTEIKLELSGPVLHYLQMMEAVSAELPLAVKQEIARMAAIIQDRVSRGGEPSVRLNPQRYAPK